MNCLIRVPTITLRTKITTISYVLTQKFFKHLKQQQQQHQQNSSCTKKYQHKYFSSSSNLLYDDDTHTNNNNCTSNNDTDTDNDNISYYKWPIQYDYSLLQLQHRLDIETNENGQFPLYTNIELQQSANSNSNKATKTTTTENQQQLEKVSAVLVLVCCIDTIPSILFTKRSITLNNHPGQISFPGGHYEYNMDGIIDNNNTQYNLINTAIRETIEELVPSNTKEFVHNLVIVGSTSILPSIKNIPVQPIIGIYYKPLYTTKYQSQLNNNTHNTNVSLSSSSSSSSSLPLLSNEFTCNNDEVDIVFTVPLYVLYNTETIYKKPSTTSSSTKKQTSVITESESSELHSPSTTKSDKNENVNRFNITHTPMFPSEYGPIWGLTAYIVQPILHRLLVPSFLLNQQQKEENSRYK